MDETQVAAEIQECIQVLRDAEAANRELLLARMERKLTETISAEWAESFMTALRKEVAA